MKQLASLDDLTGQYDVFFCDVWGVVHNGVAAHPAAVAALKRARAKGVTVILVTTSASASGCRSAAGNAGRTGGYL